MKPFKNLLNWRFRRTSSHSLRKNFGFLFSQYTKKKTHMMNTIMIISRMENDGSACFPILHPVWGLTKSATFGSLFGGSPHREVFLHWKVLLGHWFFRDIFEQNVFSFLNFLLTLFERDIVDLSSWGSAKKLPFLLRESRTRRIFMIFTSWHVKIMVLMSLETKQTQNQDNGQ